MLPGIPLPASLGSVWHTSAMGLTQPGFNDLLAAAVAGDAGSLGGLLEPYRAFLRQAAAAQLYRERSLGIDPSDVVQEVLLYVATSIGQFRGGCPQEFEAWLRSMVQSKAIDAVRRRTADRRNVDRERPLDDDSGPANGAAIAGADLSPRAHAIHRERFHAALQSIAGENQAVLRLHLVEGLPLATIAEQLALPLPEAARRLACGMRTLKRRLAADEAEP